MAKKKEIKTIQKSVSLYDLEWAIVNNIGFKLDTESRKIRAIIKEYIFLLKLCMKNPEINKQRMFFVFQTSGLEYDKIDNPYDEELKTLLDIFPDIKDIDDIEFDKEMIY